MVDNSDIEEGSTNGSIIKSTRWALVSQISGQFIRYSVSILLARLLTPDDYGLMAMALVFIGFIDTFKDLGFSSAIIQKENITDNLLSSIFYINILICFGLWGLLYAAAPLISSFFKNPRLYNILLVLGITFVINSFGLVKSALLNRNMQFRKLAIIEISISIVTGATSITMALQGFGVWALVGGTIANSLFSTIFVWKSVPWNPKIQFKISDIQTILKFGINLTISQIFAYFILKSDSIIIGRYLGPTLLGFYSLSQSIIMTPSLMITQSINRVLFPALSRIQSENFRIKESYLRACGGIASITFPLFTGAWILSEPFVIVVLGEKWIPIIPLIKILSPIAILQSLTTTVGVLYLVKGRTDLLLVWQIVSGASAIVGFLIGVHCGIVGVASAYAIVILCLTYPAFAIPFRFVEINFRELLVAILPYMILTIFMALAVTGCRVILERFGVQQTLILALSVCTGMLTYSGAILTIRPPALFEYKKFFSIRKV